MLWHLAFILAGFAGVGLGAVVPASYSIHESRDEVPSTWIKRDRLHPDSTIAVRIGLAQSNLEQAESYLLAVSDPESPNYGKHWSIQQIAETFRPSDETIYAVTQWLREADIKDSVLTRTKQWLTFNARASQLESLLQTEYYHYQNIHTRGLAPSCDRYHVPDHLKRHIDFITPGVTLLDIKAQPGTALEKRDSLEDRDNSEAPFRNQPLESLSFESRNASCRFDGSHPDCLSHCHYAMTPACIAALYKIPPSRLTPNASNKMGIYESEFQRYAQPDLDIFFARYTNSRIPNGTHPINYSIDGGRSNATFEKYPRLSTGGEISLDLDMAYPIVYPQTVGIWDENDLHYQSWQRNDTVTWGFNQLLDAIDGSYCNFTAYGETGDAPRIDPHYPDPQKHGGYNHSLQCGVYKPPTILSLSYGGWENTVPISYQKRQCLEFLKLGLQGTSILFASGDSGVGSYTRCLSKEHNAFDPIWPATCPWVTSVGGTKIYPGVSIFEKQPESVAFQYDKQFPRYNYSSSGGFSNIYPRPSYQSKAVSEWFQNYPPSYKSYAKLAPNAPNPAKVNVTDLQGSGEGLFNRIGRGFPDVSAHGARAAIVLNGESHTIGGTSAAVPIFSAIINRINEERMAVGKGAVGFLNPTLYAYPEMLNDIVNGSNVGCHTPGFYASPGWDPASGLGTPHYPKMLQRFLSLP